jgi:anti-sigma factor RsiW
MRGCLDEGVLQSYFDGELSREQMQAATLHLATCQMCAAAARQLENETTLLATALAPEFDAVIPTENLRRRIDEAIAGLPAAHGQGIRNTRTLFGWIQPLGSLFTFTPQRTLAYASLVAIVAFAVIFGVIQRQKQTSQLPVAQVTSGEKAVPPAKPNDNGQNQPGVTQPNVTQPNVTQPSVTQPGVSQPIQTAASGGSPASKQRSPKPRIAPDNQAVAQVKLMPGERSYLKTIAALDSTIKANNDRPMRSALRADYERNLAVVNRALAATRNAAKNNPNDPDAKEFMFDAYQSKVDLLNTVADARSFNRPQ